MKKTKYVLLTAGLISSLSVFNAPNAHAEQSSSFTKEQKAELETMFKDFVNENPQLILDSVKTHHENLEKKMAQGAEEKLKEYNQVFAQKDIPSAGNPDGDVTVVEFFDYNCGYCKKAFEDIQKVMEEDKNIRFVFQEMPILGASSAKMASYSLAAQKQGKYFEMHKALMSYRGSQSEEAILELAKKSGLDADKLKVDAKSSEIQKKISESIKMAQEIGIRGTPGFVIGGKIYPGYIGSDGIRGAIKSAREK